MTFRTLLVVLAFFAPAADNAPRMPMVSNYADSIQTRWLSKKVLSSKLLDEAESLDTWKLVNQGQARGDVTLTKDRAFSGTGSIRLRSSTTGDKPIRTADITAQRQRSASLRVKTGPAGTGCRSVSIPIFLVFASFPSWSFFITREARQFPTFGTIGVTAFDPRQVVLNLRIRF